MARTGAQVMDLAMRACLQFMQDKAGNIKQSIRDNRMRQAAIITALMLASKGLATIVSTKRFSTQKWKLDEHPKYFVESRPKIIAHFGKVFKK